MRSTEERKRYMKWLLSPLPFWDFIKLLGWGLYWVFVFSIIGTLVDFARAAFLGKKLLWERHLITLGVSVLYVLIYHLMQKRNMPNQLPDPTSPSVTPPAGAGDVPSDAADH